MASTFAKRCGKQDLIVANPAFCGLTRPIVFRFPPRRESRCNFRGTPITGNSGRGHWPPSECTANLFTVCNSWAKCRFTLRAGRAHGVRRCEWEAARKSLLSNLSEIVLERVAYLRMK